MEKQRYYLANKGLSSQGYGFSSGHVWMWELDCEESWVPKNWCFWTVVLEKTLERSLDCEEIQPVHSKGDQPWVFFGRTDAEAETPILWPPDVKNWLFRKDHDAGNDWRWEENGTTEDDMVGWRHWLDGHEFEMKDCKLNSYASSEWWGISSFQSISLWTYRFVWIIIRLLWCSNCSQLAIGSPLRWLHDLLIGLHCSFNTSSLPDTGQLRASLSS